MDIPFETSVMNTLGLSPFSIVPINNGKKGLDGLNICVPYTYIYIQGPKVSSGPYEETSTIDMCDS